MLLPFLLGALLLRDVHDGADEFDQLAGGIQHRMRENAHVAPRAVRQHQAILDLEVRLLPHRSLDRLGKSGPVLGVDALQGRLERRQPLRRVVAENAVALLRPVQEGVGNRAPGPASRVADLLRLREVMLAAPQRQLRALALGDVAADAAIAEEPAPGVEAGLAVDLVEPLLAVLHAGEAEIEEPLVRGEHRAVRGPARLVGRGGRNLPARPAQLEAEVAYPDVGLAELDRAVAVLGVGLPEEIARDLGQVAEARLGVGERQLRALALGDVHDEGHATLDSLVESRPPDQHGSPAAIFPEILLLEGLKSPGRVEFCDGPFVALAPFGRRQVGPAHWTRDKVRAFVSDHAQKRVIGVANPAVEVPEHDPDDVGVEQAADLGLALHAFIDVHVEAEELDHATLAVAQWFRERQEPSIFAIRTTDPVPDVIGASALDRMRPGPERLLTVFRMDQIYPAKTQEVAQRPPGVLDAPLVQIPGHAVRRHGPRENRQGLEQAADEHFAQRHRARRFLRSRAADDRGMDPTQALIELGFHGRRTGKPLTR